MFTLKILVNFATKQEGIEEVYCTEPSSSVFPGITKPTRLCNGTDITTKVQWKLFTKVSKRPSQEAWVYIDRVSK